MKYIAWTALLLVSCLSCNRSFRTASKTVILNKFITIQEEKCIEQNIPKPHSKYAIITCGDNQYGIEVADQVDISTLSLEESFKQSFSAVHYANFLRRLGIQEKLYDAFRQRAVPIDAVPMSQFSKRAMFECKPCNAVGTVIYDGEPFYYPYVESEEVLSGFGRMQYDYQVEDGFVYTYFSDGVESGVLIKSSDSRLGAEQVLIHQLDSLGTQEDPFVRLKHIRRILPIVSN